MAEPGVHGQNCDVPPPLWASHPDVTRALTVTIHVVTLPVECVLEGPSWTANHPFGRMTTPSRLDCNGLPCRLRLGVGAGRGRKLVEAFGGFDRLFNASLTDLEAAGLVAAAAQSIALGKSLESAATEFDHARELGASIIVPADAEFPRRLLEIYDPPLVLYLKGNAEVIDQPGVAVVGTRHPTPYGNGMAERLACDLAARGVVIFSGMARGVDTAAHRGSLAAHGRTVAISSTRSIPVRTRRLPTRSWLRVERS